MMQIWTHGVTVVSGAVRGGATCTGSLDRARHSPASRGGTFGFVCAARGGGDAPVHLHYPARGTTWPACGPSARIRARRGALRLREALNSPVIVELTTEPLSMRTRNPWLSLWLTGANTMLGSARSVWLREAHRQRASFMRATRRQAAEFWLGPTAPNTKHRRRQHYRS